MRPLQRHPNIQHSVSKPFLGRGMSTITCQTTRPEFISHRSGLGESGCGESPPYVGLAIPNGSWPRADRPSGRGTDASGSRKYSCATRQKSAAAGWIVARRGKGTCSIGMVAGTLGQNGGENVNGPGVVKLQAVNNATVSWTHQATAIDRCVQGSPPQAEGLV